MAKPKTSKKSTSAKKPAVKKVGAKKAGRFLSYIYHFFTSPNRPDSILLAYYSSVYQRNVMGFFLSVELQLNHIVRYRILFELSPGSPHRRIIHPDNYVTFLTKMEAVKNCYQLLGIIKNGSSIGNLN